MDRAVIIGAGQAGAQGAISLRQAGFAGEIVMLGAETAPPYQRPPLSKAYLKGELEKERLYLRPEAFYEQHNIALRLGEKAERIDRNAKVVSTSEGARVSYDKLLIATGAPPHRLNLPGGDLSGIFYLRTLADSHALQSILTGDRGGRIVIVGAGYVGLEVAAVAVAAGRKVCLLEMADRVLARVASKPVSDFYEKLHVDAGVDLQLGSSLKEFVGERGELTGVVLVSGEIIDCAAALVGIGAFPETSLASSSGLDVENGIVVDEFARTSDKHIWAAGDCANFPSGRYGRRVRMESVPNAIEQAKAAAANMAGGEVIYDPLPWFWSDQYDVKLQTAGLSVGHDALVVRGSLEHKKFSVWYFKEDRLIAVDAVNEPAAFVMAKKLILAKAGIGTAELADVDCNLKDLVH